MFDIIRDAVQKVLKDQNISVEIDRDTPLLSSGLLSSMDLLCVLLILDSKGLATKTIQVGKSDTIGEIEEELNIVINNSSNSDSCENL